MTLSQRARAGLGPDCEVIDAHTHIGAYHLSAWHEWYSHTATADVLAYSEKLGINAIVTSPHLIVPGEMERANELCFESIKKFPGRLYGYISVIPLCGTEAVKAQLKKYGDAEGFVGLKFLPGYYHGSLTSAEYAYALDFAEERACPVLCHVWADDPRLTDVEAAVEKRTKLSFILAHQGGGSAKETDRASRIVREHPNVYMELCGSLENNYSVEDLVALVGEDKVIFGTDQISLDPKYELGRVVFSPLGDAVKKKILSENYLSLMSKSSMHRIIL